MNPRVEDGPKGGNPKPKEVAESKILRDPEGRISLSADHIYGVLINAGREVILKGRSKITPSTLGQPSKLFSFLSVDQEYLPLSNGTSGSEPTWKVDTKYSYNKQRQQILNVRPRFDHWSLEGSVTIDDEMVKPELIRDLFDKAGNVCLGSFHGRFGRFKVVKWEVRDVVEDTEPALP